MDQTPVRKFFASADAPSPLRRSAGAPILVLTPNRPDRLNAVDRETHGELARTFAVANDAPGSEVIVLTGAREAGSRRE